MAFSTVPTPSKLMMTKLYEPRMTFSRLEIDPCAIALVRCIAVLNRSDCQAACMMDSGQMTKQRFTRP